MKKHTFKLFLFSIVGLVFYSCDDELNVTDPNRLSTESFYETQDDAIASVDAIYNVLITDGLYQRMTPVLGDSRSDEVRSRSPWPFLSQTSNFTVPATDGAVDWLWTGYYILISRANQAIEEIPNIEGVDENLRDRLLGQAYFLRALAYFNLTNIHDNPPLVLEAPKDQEDFFPSNQDVTQDMIYDQVESDLTEAINGLPLDYGQVSGPDNGHTGRVTLGAAKSLMGKVKLYRGRPDEALPFFRDVITSGQYQLFENYAAIFSQDPSLENANTGRIFWAEFTQSENAVLNWGGDPSVNWRQFLGISPTYSGADFWDFFPSQFLYEELREERTVDGNLDPRFASTILSYEPDEGLTQAYGRDYFLDPNLYYIAKYTLANGGGDPFRSGVNYHVIRYADVLLMYAECLALTGDIPAAAGFVQQVRDRANLPDRQAEFAGYSLDQFMDQLAHERVTELSIEGLRWFDIKRWGWLDDPQKLEELRQNDPEFDSFVNGRQYQPIPQNELDRNPNLVGNSAND